MAAASSASSAGALVAEPGAPSAGAGGSLAALVRGAAPPAPLSELPDVTQAFGFDEVTAPSFEDPALVDGVVNMEALRQQLFDRVVSKVAAAPAGEPALRQDWSNFWQCSSAIDGLFDVRAIFAGAGLASQCRATADAWFTRLLSPEVESWGIDDVADFHARVSPAALWPRLLTDVWRFLGRSLSLPPHTVAQCFEDNHIALVRTDFRTCDHGYDTTFPLARWSLLVAISGAGKSPLCRAVEQVLKADIVTQSFGFTTVDCLHSLSEFKWYATRGANFEGVIKDATENNEPIGLRVLHDEVSSTISRLGNPAKDKMRPEQVINVANPSLCSGKRLGGKSSSIDNLKITLTACVQPALCHYFVPFSPEGESFRWEPVLAPSTLGLAISRADKLVNKKASQALLSQLLASQVLKILQRMPELGRLQCCKESTGCANVIESAAKQAVQKFIQRMGNSRASEDPMRHFMQGKLDSKYLTHLAVCWLVGESLLSWVNPLYLPRFETNKIYARMAFWRTLLSEGDRRVLMLHNRRAIDCSPLLRSLASGVSEELLEEMTAKKKARSSGDAQQPRSDEQILAFVLQKIVAMAQPSSDGSGDVLEPHAVMHAFQQDFPGVKKVINSMSGVLKHFTVLSERYHLVVAAGRGYHNEPDRGVQWFDVTPGAVLQGTRALGRAGGALGCPHVRIHPAGHRTRLAVTEELSAVWVMS